MIFKFLSLDYAAISASDILFDSDIIVLASKKS